MPAENRQRIVILISGRGSNMEAIVRACRTEDWPADIAAVISNRPQAGGLQFAAEQGIATAVVDHRSYAGRASFDAALADCIDGFGADLVVLAGFMRILTPGFVARYAGRLVNIHPSLLPAFAGLGTHERALQAGCQLAGATVHLVTAELDHGPVLAQAMVPVLPDDDAERLAARVLVLEHQMYPRVLRWLLQGQLQVEGLRARHREGLSLLFT